MLQKIKFDTYSVYNLLEKRIKDLEERVNDLERKLNEKEPSICTLPSSDNLDTHGFLAWENLTPPSKNNFKN